MNNLYHNQKGIAALLTIVVVGAAALIIAYSSSILSLGELELGWDSSKGEEAFFLADGCIEEGLRRLRLNNNYSGGTLNVGDNSCIISIMENDNNRVVSAISTVSVYHKKIEVDVDITATSTVFNSWEEKDN